MWQRHRLSRDGRLYQIGTNIFSRTWFLARYRPPPRTLEHRLDAAAVKYYWTGSIGKDNGPGSELKRFRVAHRVKRDMLSHDRAHGGMHWFRTRHIICATHADMMVRWMAPVGANATEGAARWQTTGRAVIRSVLGCMAGLFVHPDIRLATRRAKAIPKHWTAYLNAWAEVREHYVLVPPSSFEEVLAMTLYDNSEVLYRGQPLPAHDWQPAIDAGVRTVADIWCESDGRLYTGPELHILPERATRLMRSLPRTWLQLLRQGRTDIGPDEWALHDGRIGDAATHNGMALIRTMAGTDDHDDVLLVHVYTQLHTRGWAEHSIKAVHRCRLKRATVEGRTTTSAGKRTWSLVGLTEGSYAQSRTRLQRRGRAAYACLSHYDIRAGCECLRGESRRTDELQSVSEMMGIHPANMHQTFLRIRRATWPAEARDFVWDLAAGALPTGRGAGLPSSRCLFCPHEADDIGHLLRCPYMRPMRDWTLDLWCLLRLTPTTFETLIVLGADEPVADVVRCAVATAMRRARAYTLINHTAMPGHSVNMVDTARRMLREHINMDRLYANGATERRRDGAHYHTRPDTRSDFGDRWQHVLCHNTTWRDTRQPLQFQAILMPGGQPARGG